MAARRAFLMKLFLLVASLPAAAAPSLSDAAGSYVVLPSRSVLAFAVPAMGGPGITGRFASFAGTVDIPADSVDAARVTITIDPGSVVTGRRRIDEFLKSNAVFDSRNERAIVFRSARVRRTGEDTATIEGELTARGRTFRETFHVRLAEARQGSLRFHVEGKVFRSRYGMDVGTPLYSNVVDFDMDLSVQRR